MRNYRYHRDKGIWFKILGGILVLSFIFTIVAQQQQKKLDVYSETDKVEKKQDVEEEAPEIATYIHTDAENHYSIEIPEEWERVTQDGYDTFIHSASGSSVQIQVKDYDPAINNLTAETASTQVAENGYTFVSFEPLDNNSYDLRYQDMKNSTYDYIEEAFWDREKSITLICVFNDQNYEKIIPYYEKILSTFAWDMQDPIPEGYRLFFSEGANCEFGLPATWELGESNGAIYATDSETGASLTANAQKYTSYLDDVTATDITSLLNRGYDNFMLKSFDTSHEKAVAVFTHIVDNVQYTTQTHLFADGETLMLLSFDYEQGTMEDSIPETCAGLYRSFAGVKNQNDSPIS